MPSVTGRRLVILALALAAAVVLAAALGESGSESRSAAAPELGQSAARHQITCDQLEAIIASPKLLERSAPSVLESAADQYRLVVPINSPSPFVVRVEHSDLTLRSRILRALHSLRDRLGLERREPAPLVTLGVQDCNQ